MTKKINLSEKFGLVGCDVCNGYGWYNSGSSDRGYKPYLCEHCLPIRKKFERELKKRGVSR